MAKRIAAVHDVSLENHRPGILQASAVCEMAFDRSLLCTFFNPTVRLSSMASGMMACLFCTIDGGGDGVSVKKRQELCKGRTIGG